MEKAIHLQKQIRDNAQDLHSYMQDLGSWEKDMKRKEAELTGVSVEQEYPPVRSKIKKSKPVKPQSKSEKKITGFDYSAWDKFDADKACDEVDEEDIGPTSYDSKMSEEQKLEKLREEAQDEKEKGNQFVKLQKWDDAISCYTRAIQLHNNDAIYYANRGLCYLKKENLHAAESDCTKALELDPKYVKALQRRSCAREALGSLRRAASDLREILELEPGNVVVKRQLLTLTQRMGTKGPNSKSSPATTPAEEPPKNGLMQLEPNQPSTDPQSNNNLSSNGTVTPIMKPPHLRSKKPLVRVPIRDILLGESIPEAPVEESTEDSCLKTEKNPKETNGNFNRINGVEKKNDSETLPKQAKNDSASVYEYEAKETAKIKVNGVHNIESVDIKSLQLNDLQETVLQVPKSSVQFISQWRLLRGRDKERSKYLKAIPPAQLPSIFQNFLESDTLSEILEILHNSEDFNQSDSTPLPYLEYLSKVKRFSALAMFLSEKDKQGVLKTLECCKNEGKCSQKEFTEMKIKYEL